MSCQTMMFIVYTKKWKFGHDVTMTHVFCQLRCEFTSHVLLATTPTTYICFAVSGNVFIILLCLAVL